MNPDHRATVASESERFHRVVADALAAGRGDAPVPGCPAWTLSDLAFHLADVQRWAAGIITSGSAGEPDPPDREPADGAEAVAGATATLLAALDGADPADPAWNFSSAPRTKAFWFRRQALEVALHRWDAESAVRDDPAPLDGPVAADVVDEFVHVMLRRVIDREGVDLSPIAALGACDVHLHCTDADELGVAGEYTIDVVDGDLRIVEEHRRAAVAIRGPAADLALFLYGRAGGDAGPGGGVEVLGDRAVLDAWAPVLRF
jgi:uncharacterized protein (TIGR03083 family)